MRKLYQSLFILVYLVGFVSYSQVNPFASAVWIKRTDIGCANCDQFFNTSTKSVGGYDQQRNAIEPGGGNWTNSEFHARNFSNHISGSGTLLLKGSEIKTIKTSSQNVCEPLLFYKFNDL